MTGRDVARYACDASMLRLLLALFAVPSCSDDCIDGVCPRFDLPERYPGPCASAMEADRRWMHCRYRSDEARIVKVDCDWYNDEFGDGYNGVDTTVWTYDAAGQPARVEKVSDYSTYLFVWAWQLEGDPIGYYEQYSAVRQLEEVASYDRATFAFLPMPGAEVFPEAKLGLIRMKDATFTWSGSGTTLTRTASDGSVVTFELDDRGHVVHEGAASYDETWRFDGDRLSKDVYVSLNGRTERNYAYDSSGNIAIATTSWAHGDERVVYSYNCW